MLQHRQLKSSIARSGAFKQNPTVNLDQLQACSMMVYVTTTISLLALAAMALVAMLSGNRLPREFARRKCQGRAWRVAFPDSSSADLRDFLAMFVQSFAIANKDMLKLRPDDSITSIYRAIYRHWWMVADALELETLADSYEARYGESFASQWHERMTLGELFGCTQDLNLPVIDHLPRQAD